MRAAGMDMFGEVASWRRGSLRTSSRGSTSCRRASWTVRHLSFTGRPFSPWSTNSNRCARPSLLQAGADARTRHTPSPRARPHLPSPSVRTVSGRYSRPVSRTASRISFTLEIDLHGRSNSRSDSCSNSSPKTPPVGPLPLVPEHHRRPATSPSGPRVGSIRRASSLVYDGRIRSLLSRASCTSDPRLVLNSVLEPRLPLAAPPH
jgi:hypothetical protein